MSHDEYDNQEENVLKYIYKLNEHLENIKYVWQGLVKDEKGKLIRIADPVAPDSFIYSQISSLKTVLNPHNFVSQLKREEKNNLILDTFKAFLATMLKQKFFHWDSFQMVANDYYNTLHLFLNILEGGFGAQFTLGAQTGITQRIHRDEEKKELRPYIDIPKTFGLYKDKEQTKDTNLIPKSEEEDSYD